MISKLDFLDDYIESAQNDPELQSLRSVQNAFFRQGFLNDNQWHEGQLPFIEFSSMVARTLGKQRPLPYGGWARFDGSLWDVIHEKYPNEKEGCGVLLSIYRTFRSIVAKRRYVNYLRHPTPDDYSVRAVEIWEYSQNAGFAMLWVFADGSNRVECFFPTLPEILKYAHAASRIAADDWELIN